MSHNIVLNRTNLVLNVTNLVLKQLNQHDNVLNLWAMTLKLLEMCCIVTKAKLNQVEIVGHLKAMGHKYAG